MDKQFRNLLVYFMALVLLAMVSCKDEKPIDPNNAEIKKYETETFRILLLMK